MTYDVYAGYLIGELPYFLKTGETFVPRLAPVNLFYAGAGVGLKLPMGFGLQAGVRYDSYNNAGNFWSGRGGRVGMGIPEFTVTGRASYCYRDRFSVGISVEVLGGEKIRFPAKPRYGGTGDGEPQGRCGVQDRPPVQHLRGWRQPAESAYLPLPRLSGSRSQCSGGNTDVVLTGAYGLRGTETDFEGYPSVFVRTVTR